MWIFALFLAKFFNNLVLTEQENLYFECVLIIHCNIGKAKKICILCRSMGKAKRMHHQLWNQLPWNACNTLLNGVSDKKTGQNVAHCYRSIDAKWNVKLLIIIIPLCEQYLTDGLFPVFKTKYSELSAWGMGWPVGTLWTSGRPTELSIRRMREASYYWTTFIGSWYSWCNTVPAGMVGHKLSKVVTLLLPRVWVHGLQ